MSAEYGNIVEQNRNNLQDVIPLSTPYAICVDPSNLCNFRCHFCAVQYSDEKFYFKKQVMDLNLFKKIVCDISEFDKPLKVLRMNGQGEPLVNPNFPEMVSYAKKAGIAEKIETITNGSLLNPELNDRLISCGIDRIRISIESIDAEGYKNITGKNVNFEDFIENIRDLHEKSGDCEIYCKIVDVAVPNEEDKDHFKEIISGVCDRYFIDRVIPLWSDYDEIKKVMVGDDEGVHGQRIKHIKICPYPFYSLIVNPDGEVTACCADWKRKYVVGNLQQESLLSVWNGPKLRKMWKKLASGQKDDFEMCRKCVLPSFDCNDDIDEYGDLILSKL
ncbi:MAG: radical SAM protein [Lachnospiraceae bacterium]|nr:radical SAM protein [Lachnospiraceae bacterium]